MSTHNTDNPSPNLTENLTENRSQEITGTLMLPENTVHENTSPVSRVETAEQDPASFPSAYQTNRRAKGRGRPSLKMTKEQLMAAIGECADALGHVPSHAELMRSGKVSGRQIVKHFGTYTRALRACNLESSTGGKKLPLEKLFLDWARVVRELKKIPSKSEYEHLGKHSDTPLKTRFGSWGQVPRYLRRYMEEQGLTEEWKDVLELIREYEQGQDGMEMAASPECEQKKPRVMTDRPVYGPLIRPYPMIHGPINENGVLYLFGTLSEKLGFVVTLVQCAFPDCLALRLVDVDRWQPVRIEFEYESRNFLKHLHDPSQCDIIVCWRHNWPECPLEVIELSKVVGEGSS
jgi:Homing endonuclease associated repeat